MIAKSFPSINRGKRLRVRVKPRWLAGIAIQKRVIEALMIRDALSRYGHENFGFFWVIGEPLLLSTSIMLIWSIMGLTHGSNVAVVPFALTGYTFITLWRHIVFRSVKTIRGNANLRYHRQVDILDVLIGRAALETVAIFAAFIVAFLPLWLLGFCPSLNDPLTLVGGFALSAFFSFGFGLILAGLSELNETVEHLIGPVMYVSLPLTGIFFMVDWLPPQAQEMITWSPLVNGIEMYRSGLFPAEIHTHWSASYLASCSFIVNAIGIPLCSYAKKKAAS